MTVEMLRQDLLSHPVDVALMLGPCVVFLAITYVDYRSRRKPNLFLRRVFSWVGKMILRLLGVAIAFVLIFVVKLPQAALAFIAGTYAGYYQPLGTDNAITVIACTTGIVLMYWLCIRFIRAGMR